MLRVMGSNSVSFSFDSYFCFDPQKKAFNPIALRKAKIVDNFGLSECNMVEGRSHIRKDLFPREANRKS